MRMRDYLEQASTRGIPDWLVQETPGAESGSIQSEWARRLADPSSDEGTRRLAAAMMQLRSQRPVRPLLGRSNAMALRWVETATNRCRLAQQLRDAAPSMHVSHRIFLRLNGCAWRVAAAILLLSAKAGLFTAIDGVTRVVERVSRLHIDRHIGPMI